MVDETSWHVITVTSYWARDGVSNHQPHDCLLSRLFRRRSKKGIHRWPVNSPIKGPVTRKMFPFDDVIICHLERLHNKVFYQAWIHLLGSNNYGYPWTPLQGPVCTQILAKPTLCSTAPITDFAHNSSRALVMNTPCQQENLLSHAC